jgi:hypothetical protein
MFKNGWATTGATMANDNARTGSNFEWCMAETKSRIAPLDNLEFAAIVQVSPVAEKENWAQERE